MNDPFFLTRQTANLMEDFAREINAGSALFLLYGDDGVGKSRLLQELGKNRLSRRVLGIELKSGEQDGKSSQDRSAEIEKIFEGAQEGDIIIADHFEAALKKTRHQLFLSWSTDGADKQLNLIICSSTDGFNELRQLTSQYQVSAQSFQLMPFDSDEIEAFLGFHLFPNQTVGKLSIPTDLREQFAAAKGRVGNLIEIAERAGDQIKIAPVGAGASIRQGNWVIASALVVVLLAGAIAWYLFSGPRNFDTVADIPTQPEIEVLPDEAQTLSETELALEPETDAVIESTLADTEASDIQLDIESAEEIAALEQAEVAAESDELTEPDAEIVAEGETEVTTADKTVLNVSTPEPGTVTETEALAEAPPDSEVNTAAAAAESAETIAPAELGLSERFERDLQDSMDWLQNRSAETGTVQILLLNHDGFDVNSYYDYAERLQRGQVDLSKMRVFKTLTANRVVYSVVYDEFATRRAAARAINELPQALRDLSPIPRSVGGLEQEIQRLEAKN